MKQNSYLRFVASTIRADSLALLRWIGKLFRGVIIWGAWAVAIWVVLTIFMILRKIAAWAWS